MTNQQIVLIESQKLAQAGVIDYTGNVFKALDASGKEIEYKETEQIHTYQGWKSMGYVVKRGEKAIAKFPVWKYVLYVSKEDAKKVDETDTDHIEGQGKMYMKTAAWFKESQVEVLAK